MSGPVWRKVDDETAVCDLCLAQVTSVLVEGSVEDGEFKPHRRLCQRCFHESISLLALTG